MARPSLSAPWRFFGPRYHCSTPGRRAPFFCLYCVPMEARTYVVRRAAAPLPAVADWEAPAWRGLPALAVDLPAGKVPAHRPRTLARICWDDRFLHVMFQVHDRYVRAVA